jgi:hypothetical protein
MKIRINDEESYEIKIPNEIEARDFLNLLNSFDNIVRLIRINNIPKELVKLPKIITETNKKGRIRGTKKHRDWADTREKVLDIMQYAYHGNKEDRKRIMRITGVNDFQVISKSFFWLVKRYQLKPEEVGMVTWKGKMRIPYYTIKSYTGLFDE